MQEREREREREREKEILSKIINAFQPLIFFAKNVSSDV